MRITPTMISGNYSRNLNKNLNKLNKLYDVCLTGRKFSRASSDPSSYIKESSYKRQSAQIDNYLNNINFIKSKFECAEGSMQEINSMFKSSQDLIANAMTGTLNQDNRKTIANQLRGIQDSIIKSCNSQLAGNYIFGGCTTKTPPLSYDRDTNTLTYNGLDVSDPANLPDLSALASEKLYADIGFLNDNSNANSQNAMNFSLSALNMIGFGQTTVDGQSVDKNIVVLLGDIANALESDTFTSDDIKNQYSVVQQQHSSFLSSLADMGSKTSLLENTGERLSDLEISVSSSIAKIAFTDQATAISEFQMQQLVYNVSMQFGANIIPNTLFNFIK